MKINTISNPDKDKLHKSEISYILFCFVLYFIWSIAKELNYAPDEAMRYLIPEYIFQHNQLPNGNMDFLRNNLWGFSYAYYPNFLGPLLSAFFMKFVSLFTADSFCLLAASRFPSVLSGTATVYFAFKSGKRLFSKNGCWFFVISLSMIPQFVFLTSYVNNDMLAICGSAIILYSWLLGLQNGWNYKNSALLALGIIISALSYYNSYGWIMCSIFVFGLSYLLQIRKESSYKDMIKLGIFISVLVLASILYFFIRNAILYNGDFLGIKALTASSQQFAPNEWKPSNRNTPKNLGMSVPEMFISRYWTGTPWIIKTYITFIGAFGFSDVFLPMWVYVFYTLIFIISFSGLMCSFFDWIRSEKSSSSKSSVLFHCALSAAFIIPVILAVYYSYAIDYQPQGRYCYPMILAFVYFETVGLLRIAEKKNHLRKILLPLLGILIVSITLYVTFFIYLPHS